MTEAVLAVENCTMRTVRQAIATEKPHQTL